MLEKLRSIAKYSGIAFKALIFIIGLIVIVYFFPKEGKFRYEFQQGKPWLHENFYAPVDFPVYKSKKELKQERDSVQQQKTPCFRFDKAVSELSQQKLNEKIESIVEQQFGYDRRVTQDSLKQLSENIEVLTLPIFQQIYELGVLPELDQLKLNKEELQNLVVIRNNVAEEYSYFELYTPLKAEHVLRDQLLRLRNTGAFAFLGEFDLLKNIGFADNFSSNLIYDEELSQVRQQAQLEDISLTYGLVRKGELLISSGDLVTPEKAKILSSFKIEYETNMGAQSNGFLLYLARLLLVFAALFVLFLFLYNFRMDILKNWNKTLFILLLIVMFVALAGLTNYFGQFNIYIIPFALVPIIINTFYDGRIAIFTHIITIMCIGFIAPNGFEFVFIQFVAGIIAVFSLYHARKRSQLFWSAFIVFITYSMVHFAFSILHEGNLKEISWTNFIWFAGNGILLLTSYPLIYIFEKTFGFLSDLTLLELSDTNTPLLRLLNEKAPGTFQHSLQVANLAEEAIIQIGGNSQLIRCGALYHDIGKMDSPAYFIENQTPGHNPHDELDFEESADIIIGHVERGMKIAKKHNLPKQVIEFIQSHHGTSTVQYFYRSFLKKYPEEEADISRFTYAGPVPHSRETAVLMMADSIEAASRSLKSYTERSISELVDGIINYQLKEGQFDDADITFKDISTIKEIFVDKLKTIYHTRIEYPK